MRQGNTNSGQGLFTKHIPSTIHGDLLLQLTWLSLKLLFPLAMAALGQVSNYNNKYISTIIFHTPINFVGAKEFSFINYDGYLEEDKVQSIELL